MILDSLPAVFSTDRPTCKDVARQGWWAALDMWRSKVDWWRGVGGRAGPGRESGFGEAPRSKEVILLSNTFAK